MQKEEWSALIYRQVEVRYPSRRSGGRGRCSDPGVKAGLLVDFDQESLFLLSDHRREVDVLPVAIAPDDSRSGDGSRVATISARPVLADSRRFSVEWQEWVYDAFDDLESINNYEAIEIDAPSLEWAIQHSQAAISAVVRCRRRYQQWSSGMFIANLIALVDQDGNRHQIEKRYRLSDWMAVEA